MKNSCLTTIQSHLFINILKYIFFITSLVSIYYNNAYAKISSELEIQDLRIKVELSSETGTLILLQGKKELLREKLNVNVQPKLEKFYSFKKQNELFILLDYLRGSESGTKQRTECYDVLLYRITSDKKLQLMQKENYRCDVATSIDWLKEKEFYHPYEINQNSAKIIYKFAPKK
jgi:hypothetical protein